MTTDRHRTNRPGPVDGAGTLSRRQALGLGAGAFGLAVAGVPDPATAETPQPTAVDPVALAEALRPAIMPRDAWGADLPVTGTIEPEDDVRFLLVHHTASPNDYGAEDVAGQIRSFHRFHTGPEKGWPDVAYNFFIDRFGGIWEARAGSLAGAVRGDATGGSQGHALLCSLIGDHRETPITAEAQTSLVALLAWLAVRHDVDPTPGATTRFVSRGSNRWPAGTEVTARTIAGHRDMSQTTCPGDAVYGLLERDLPTEVVATIDAAARSLNPATTTDDAVVLVPAERSTTTEAATTATTSTPSAEAEAGQAMPAAGDDRPGGRLTTVAAVGAGVAAAALIGAARLRSRAAD
ncbi:MAG: peptidoglycan recognition family protein [Actinomycetota bacterium]